ncbi:MAG: hypothetical protein S4CHLAM123_07730 [Chlamydiales bacterium]|nr:hypothetical protein [Chlamydiales bacterium]
MKEILKQLITVFRDLKPIQKGMTCLVLILVGMAMSFLLFKSSNSNYVSLFPAKSLSKTEVEEIRTYLKHFAVPFEEDKELKVLAEHVDQIRTELAAAGIPSHNERKGFELFDTNTWIKGEKELEVLEMRALKGQLEKDLTGFEHIKSASVILDIPPQRSFGGSKYQTKASVILTLMPGARLFPSELRAITNHLAGAVRGLESNMIAISDTSGKLYKALDPEGEEELFSNAQILFEMNLEEKIFALLKKLVGEEHFYTTVQVSLEPQTEAVHTLSIATAIDQHALIEVEEEVFKIEIKEQLAAIARGYGIEIEPTVHVLPFEKKRKVWKEHKQRINYTGLIFSIIFVSLALICIYFLTRRYKRNKEEEDETLFRLMTRMDLDQLADSIKGEDSETIALMLSYLEPKRAELMILALDDQLQEKVLMHLSEMEQEGL